jgi:hypothetical protein
MFSNFSDELRILNSIAPSTFSPLGYSTDGAASGYKEGGKATLAWKRPLGGNAMAN